MKAIQVHQFGGPEVRPQNARKHQLGIRALPQQKVAQAALAAGADQQIHRRPQPPLDTGPGETGNPGDSSQNGVPAGIIEGDA